MRRPQGRGGTGRLVGTSFREGYGCLPERLGARLARPVEAHHPKGNAL